MGGNRESEIGNRENGGRFVWKSQELVEKYLSGIRAAIPLAGEQMEMMLRMIDAGAGRVERILDLGCGGGTLAAALLARYPQAQATLVDFSEPMIEEARKSLAPYGDACRFVLADLADAGWQTAIADRAPFDAVVSGYAIHHVTDERKHQLYAEIFGLLRPGGMFVNVEHVKSATDWLQNLCDEMIIDSIYAYHTAQGGKLTREQVGDDFVRRPDKESNILAMVEDQCAWLREIGFADVDCYLKVYELAVFGGRRPA
jgi:ubiquinone/menaquinone biosynthesis C-methylase UbiE